MCFTLPSQDTPISTASKDIIAYKIGEKNAKKRQFNSLYNPFIYFRDERNSEVKLLLRSYEGTTKIEEGYHSYSKLPIWWNFNNPHVGIFKIPEGSKYYENIRVREYVSSQLIYLGPNTKLNRLYLRLFKGIKF